MMFWLGTGLFIMAVIFLILAVVKKQASAPTIVGIAFGVLALILFVVCLSQYSKINDRYEAVNALNSYSRYFY